MRTTTFLKRLLIVSGVVVACSAATCAHRQTGLSDVRYTGYGAASPGRDRSIVTNYWNHVDEEEAPGEGNDSRAFMLRAQYRASREEQYGKDAGWPMTGSEVVVLVETLPDGLEIANGQVKLTEGSSLELLGHFDVSTDVSMVQEVVIRELKVLATKAGGNVVVLSFKAGAEQGQCRGGAGLILRAHDFDAKKTRPGRLPAEM